MAFAFGIQYGLDDIKRANEAITKELDQQLAITRQLAREQRMISGRPAFELGAGPAAAGNAVQGKREEEVAFDRQFERKLRGIRGQFAGTAFDRLRGGTGSARNVGDVAALLQGGVSVRNVQGAMELASDAALSGRLGGAMGAAARALLPLGALSATAGAIMGAAYQLLAEPPKKVMDAVNNASKEFRNLQKQFNVQGDRITSAPIDTGAIRGFAFDQFDREQGFYGRMELSAKLAEDVYKYSSALLSADPKDAARYLNLPGYQSRSSVRYYVKQLLTQGDYMPIKLAGRDMEESMLRIKKRQQEQAAMFETDPDAASAWHERKRVMAWQDGVRARSLQDWSKS